MQRGADEFWQPKSKPSPHYYREGPYLQRLRVLTCACNAWGLALASCWDRGFRSAGGILLKPAEASILMSGSCESPCDMTAFACLPANPIRHVTDVRSSMYFDFACFTELSTLAVEISLVRKKQQAAFGDANSAVFLSGGSRSLCLMHDPIRGLTYGQQKAVVVIL